MAVLLLAASVTACSYQPRTALRLNADGTLDMVTCETIEKVAKTSIEYTDSAGDPVAAPEGSAPEWPSSLSTGQVVHLGATPTAEWETVLVDLISESEWSVWMGTSAWRLKTDEWVWANQDDFGLLGDVKHCDILE